jgi:hypothetical protein
MPTGYENDLSITDLIAFFLEYRLNLFGATIGGAVIGLGLAWVLPAKYEVVLPIQISEVGDMGRVESPAVVIERIKSDGFRNRIARDHGDVSVRASVKVDPIKGTELVLLKTTATSVDRANLVAQAYLSALAESHRSKAEPYRQRMLEFLNGLRTEQARALKTRNELLATITRGPNASDGAMLLKTNLVTLQDNYLQSVSTRILVLQAEMDLNRNFDTRAFVETEADSAPSPVFPRPEVFGLAGFFLGGFVMLLALIVRQAWVRRPIDLPKPA